MSSVAVPMMEAPMKATATLRRTEDRVMRRPNASMSRSPRASAYLYNTTDDIEAFLAALAKVRPYFGL